MNDWNQAKIILLLSVHNHRLAINIFNCTFVLADECGSLGMMGIIYCSGYLTRSDYCG